MNRQKTTKTAIRYAIYNDNLGGYIAKKNTHRGCTDYYLLDTELKPKIFNTPEQALNARGGNGYNWYH